MLTSKIKKIQIPKQIYHGIQTLNSGYSQVFPIGFDVETVKGEIYSLQLDSTRDRVFQVVKGWTEEEILNFIFKHVRQKEFACLFAHNLSFDLGVAFNDLCYYKPKERYGYNFRILYPHPVYMRVHDPKKRKTLQFMDTIAYFKESLDGVAKTFDLKVRKLKHPSYLGERQPKKKEMTKFKKYAMVDAEIVGKVGTKIASIHQDFDINANMTVSPASLASKIFRKYYLEDIIPYPDRHVVESALLSYNGGRTEAFCFGTKNCSIYDFNSAYPYAMTQIPLPMEKDKWEYVRDFKGENGFYYMSGSMPNMKISPLPYKTQRLIFPVGKFNNVCVTGYEAKQIIEHGDVSMIRGFVYKGKSSNSLIKYIMYFYKQKNMCKDKDPVMYQFYKLLLNALYGKFIQLNYDPDSEHIFKNFVWNPKTSKLIEIPTENKYVAGGMFNPIIASWITGFARARLFESMKKYEDYVMYCDTDSIIVKGKKKLPISKKLGDLSFEGYGQGKIIREKLYLIKLMDGKNKSGLHGFHGRESLFEELVEEGKESYSVKRMIQLREARIQKKKAFVMEEQNRIIKFDSSMKREKPSKKVNLRGFTELNPLNLSNI